MDNFFEEEDLGPLAEFFRPSQDVLICRDTNLTKHVDEVAKTESDKEIHYGE